MKNTSGLGNAQVSLSAEVCAKAKKTCLDRCPQGYQYNVRDVNPCDIRMSGDDIAWARLHKGGRLLCCMACGCVWERYHDEIGVCLDKIGTFNLLKSPHLFERYILPW